MKTFLLALSLMLPTLTHAEAPCVTCYQPLDGAVLEKLTGLKIDPPERIDVLAQLRAFATVPEAKRLESADYDVDAAAGYLITADRRTATLEAYTKLEVADLAVDLTHVRRVGDAVEVPFVASVAWTRAGSGHAGQTWVHGRARASNMRINSYERKIDKLNAGLASAVKLDVLVGDYGLASSERARRTLVREVVFPAVVAQVYAPIMNLWTGQLVQWLNENLPRAIQQAFGGHDGTQGK